MTANADGVRKVTSSIFIPDCKIASAIGSASATSLITNTGTIFPSANKSLDDICHWLAIGLVD